MQPTISKDHLWEKIELLNSFQQQTVVAFVDSLLNTQAVVDKRDKRKLLHLSVWSEQEVQLIEAAQDRVNAWQIPTF